MHLLSPTAFLFRGREFQKRAIPLHCNLNDPNEATAPELSSQKYRVTEGKYLLVETKLWKYENILVKHKIFLRSF